MLSQQIGSEQGHLRKEAPSSIASSRPPIGAAKAVDTPAHKLSLFPM